MEMKAKFAFVCMNLKKTGKNLEIRGFNMKEFCFFKIYIKTEAIFRKVVLGIIPSTTFSTI